jgi:hypothetical protein
MTTASHSESEVGENALPKNMFLRAIEYSFPEYYGFPRSLEDY